MVAAVHSPKRQPAQLQGRLSGDRRQSPRLRYCWPVWYSRDGKLDLRQGRMVDLCAGGACFLASLGEYLEPGMQMWLRGDYPLEQKELLQSGSFTTVGQVLRTQPTGMSLRQVVVQFKTSLEPNAH